MNELPPSIIVDDHGTVKHAEFIRVLGGGQALYRIMEPGPEPPKDRLTADMERAMALIGKAFATPNEALPPGSRGTY